MFNRHECTATYHLSSHTCAVGRSGWDLDLESALHFRCVNDVSGEMKGSEGWIIPRSFQPIRYPVSERWPMGCCSLRLIANTRYIHAPSMICSTALRLVCKLARHRWGSKRRNDLRHLCQGANAQRHRQARYNPGRLVSCFDPDTKCCHIMAKGQTRKKREP